MSLIPAFDIGLWNAWIFMVWPLIQTGVMRLVSKEICTRAGHSLEIKHSHTYKIASCISLPTWLLATVYSIFLPFQLGTVWFWIGLSIFLLGSIVLTVTTVNFATAPINEPITQGIYRYSRHPMYIAIFLLYLSVAIASTSWFFLLVSILWLVLISLTVTEEERYCMKKYGVAYGEYMNRTARWIGIPKQ